MLHNTLGGRHSDALTIVAFYPGPVSQRMKQAQRLSSLPTSQAVSSQESTLKHGTLGVCPEALEMNSLDISGMTPDCSHGMMSCQEPPFSLGFLWSSSQNKNPRLTPVGVP